MCKWKDVYGLAIYYNFGFVAVAEQVNILLQRRIVYMGNSTKELLNRYIPKQYQ